MDRFFERYGRLIIVAVVVCFVILFLTPMRGAIGGSVDKIAGDFANTVDKSLGKVRTPDIHPTGTVLKYQGYEMIVLKRIDNNQYLVMIKDNIGNIKWQPNQDKNGNYDLGYTLDSAVNQKRFDGMDSNTYENSYIDNYLENNWYTNLPLKLKKSIQISDIKQNSYKNGYSNSKWAWLCPDNTGKNDWYYNEGTNTNKKWVHNQIVNVSDDENGVYPLYGLTKCDTNFEGKTYNIISRHVYLPSVEEADELVNLNSANSVLSFVKKVNHNSSSSVWTRDSKYNSQTKVVFINKDCRSIDFPTIVQNNGVHPCFVIDISKIDYTIREYLNFK